MATTPLPPAPAKGPIFLIGAMGSGTTLLRLVLDSHPNIAIPQETGFMRAYNAHKFIPFKWSGKNWAKRLGWSHEELDQELGAFYDRLFMRYVSQHGKQRWGEKTPLHTWHIDDMARVFPDAVFIGIVRHPGGSVSSNMTRWRHPLPKATYHYQRYNKEIARQAARHPDRFVLMRYEELLLQPEPVLRELLDWLGEPWSEQVLEHHNVQGERGGKTMVEGRVKVDDPIDVSRLDKWTRTMDATTRKRLTVRLKTLGEFFGYAMDDPAVIEPLNERGSFLVSGAEVDARIDRFASLEIRKQEPIPRFDRLYHPREFTLARVPPPEEVKAKREEAVQADAQPSVARRVGERLPLKLRRRLVKLAGNGNLDE